jgi:hypothetical protein
MFRNCTGRRILLETWAPQEPDGTAILITRVAKGEWVNLPKSATNEWIIYLSHTFTRIGKFCLEPAKDGHRVWSEYVAGTNPYDVAYVPKKEGTRDYYVAWRCPTAGS